MPQDPAPPRNLDVHSRGPEKPVLETGFTRHFTQGLGQSFHIPSGGGRRSIHAALISRSTHGCITIWYVGRDGLAGMQLRPSQMRSPRSRNSIPEEIGITGQKYLYALVVGGTGALSGLGM